MKHHKLCPECRHEYYCEHDDEDYCTCDDDVAEKEKENYQLLIVKNLTTGTDKDFNMAVDGSIKPIDFRYIVPDDANVILYRLLLIVPDDFFSLSIELSVCFYDKSDKLLLEIPEFYTSIVTAEAGMSVVRWTFIKYFNQIILSPKQYIQIRIQDDLRKLVGMRALIQGRHE